MTQSEQRVRISLCMIVRDEADKLARCLRSASPWVDEIVIVDTGSKDRTIEIAKEFGAKVIEVPWDDSFSAPRNVAIDAASGEWILSLDADETLSSTAGIELQRCIDAGGFIGAYIPLRDIADEGKQTVALMFRAFQNRPDIRWTGRIHEQTLPAALKIAKSEGLRFGQLTGEILHDGYTTEAVTAHSKNERNRRIFERQIAETPNDLYQLYKFGDWLRRFEEDAERVYELLGRAYEIARSLQSEERHGLTYVGDLCGLFALALLQRGENERALEVTEYGIKEARQVANLWFVHAHALFANGDFAGAEAAFRKTKEFAHDAQFVPPAHEVATTKSDIGIVRTIARQGDSNRAAEEAWNLLANQPENQELVSLWTEAEAAARNISRYSNRLIERVQAHPLCGLTWMRGGELFFKLRMFDKALPWLLRATETLEDPAPAFADVAECYLAMGYHTKAVEAFSQGIPSARCRAGILLLSIAYGLDIEMEVEPTDASLRGELRSIVRNLKDLGERHLSRKLEEALNSLEDVHPTAHAFLETALA